MIAPQPFEIIADDNATHGTDGVRTVTLLDKAGRMFRRRGVKGVGGSSPQPVEWLVVELDGVFIYQSAQGVVVTKQDLQP